MLTPAGRSFYQGNAHLMAGFRETVETARRIADGKAGLLCVAYMAFAATNSDAMRRYEQKAGTSAGGRGQIHQWL